MSKHIPLNFARVNRRSLLQSAFAAGVVAAFPRPLFATSQSTLVETAAGKLQGAESNGVKVFKGIQYGAPPTGTGRFKAPGLVAKWAGIKDALEYGHCSPQGNSLIRMPSRGTGISLEGENPTFAEDCLYLNVWTPALDSGKRPVLVWVHGGGWSTGSGGSILYDGGNMARTQDVVVVTINHRLNVFGYLDLSAIAGKEYADSSCAGLHDVVLAFTWVKENIARFGGNPTNVTVFGESGGGRKVSTIMAFPPAQGLFHRAVVESGSALRMDSKEVATERAQKFLDALEIKSNQINKLLALPADAL